MSLARDEECPLGWGLQIVTETLHPDVRFRIWALSICNKSWPGWFHLSLSAQHTTIHFELWQDAWQVTDSMKSPSSVVHQSCIRSLFNEVLRQGSLCDIFQDPRVKLDYQSFRYIDELGTVLAELHPLQQCYKAYFKFKQGALVSIFPVDWEH